MNFESYKKETCRYSGEKLPDAFLDLGVQPLANNLIVPKDAGKEEFKCPLRLVRAPGSGLVQLSHVVPPDLMFSHYLYVSSTTKTFQEHFGHYAKSVRAKMLADEKLVAVDIGSNDGLLLSCYQKEGFDAIGVDPAKNLAAVANEQGRKTINGYFDEISVKQILAEHGKAHVISGNNVFAHIDDIHSVCKNVTRLMDSTGLFVIEFPYLPIMLEQMLFDMIYHEHVSYIAINPLLVLLNQFGLEIFDIEEVNSHGGSLRVFIQFKKGPRKVEPIVNQFVQNEIQRGYLKDEIYQAFASRVMQIKADFRALITQLRSEGKRIVGYGAPAKASTLLNFYELTPAEIEFVVDDNPLKQNLLIPGVHIPIVPSTILETKKVDVIIIFAWNFANEILKKIGSLSDKGTQFMLPLPTSQAANQTAQQNSFEIIPIAT